MEYRTLTNFWIYEDALRSWVFRNTEKAVNAAVVQPEFRDEDGRAIVDAINSNDKQLAEMLINKFNLEVVHCD